MIWGFWAVVCAWYDYLMRFSLVILNGPTHCAHVCDLVFTPYTIDVDPAWCHFSPEVRLLVGNAVRAAIIHSNNVEISVRLWVK